MLRAVLFIGLLAFVRSQSTSVSRCTNHGGELPTNTYIENCITPPCQLPQLQDAVINMEFRVPRSTNSMRTLVTAYLRVGLIWIPVPYDLDENSHTCNFINSSCPVSAGDILLYNLKMFIEPIFPVGISPTLEFRIVDENNEPMICIRVPITVTAPVKALDSGDEKLTIGN